MPEKKTEETKSTALKIANNQVIETTENMLKDLVLSNAIEFSAGYNYQENVRDAYLKIVEVEGWQQCGMNSIAESMYRMVGLELSVKRNQCYFLKKKDKMILLRSYFGEEKILKELTGGKVITCNIVYEGDVFEIGTSEDGFYTHCVKKHIPKFENIGKKITGAYAIIQFPGEERLYTETMTMAQIDIAWGHSSMTSRTIHKEYPDQMAKRTVIKRACKRFINSAEEFVEPRKRKMLKIYNDSTAEEFDKLDTVEQKISIDYENEVGMDSDDEFEDAVEVTGENPFDVKEEK